ncbi:unnamed protein product [Symbiodinium sp. CCMP2456]|nr:unnamed protein product [Symbiodinium sp. CCMP2456]
MSQCQERKYVRSKAQALAASAFQASALRQAGCTIVQATRAEELMELAIEAPDVKPPKRSRARYFYCAAGIIVFVILLLVAVVVLEVSQASQGWEVGTCSMTLFHNQTCFQAFAMHVVYSLTVSLTEISCISLFGLRFRDVIILIYSPCIYGSMISFVSAC